MKIVLIIAFLLITLVIIVTTTLIKNQARFFEPPGFNNRLSIYLGQHTAATSDNHPFPELRTPVFSVSPSKLFDAVLEGASEIGWQIREIDDENIKVALVITTPLLGFNDDLVVQVASVNAQSGSEKSTLSAQSTSRKGKADFAANAGHIQTLVKHVRQKLNQGQES